MSTAYRFSITTIKEFIHQKSTNRGRYVVNNGQNRVNVVKERPFMLA